MAKLVIRTDGLPAETIALKSGRNRLGRSSENDFQIQHPTVSRFHCEVEVLADAMFARDMDSSNGTFVNDQPVSKAQLETGHVLRLGDVSLEVKDAPEPTVAVDTLPLCFNHPQLLASMECTKCHKQFCGPCIHILKRSGGNVLRLCPVCSGHCEPIKGLGEGKKKSLLGGLMKLFKR